MITAPRISRLEITCLGCSRAFYARSGRESQRFCSRACRSEYASQPLTQSLAKERFSYDADTGKLIWRMALGSRAEVGKEAGSISKNGYLIIGIGGIDWLTHRIIWLMTHGDIPSVIDHADGNPLNNRIQNLRAADKSLNGANRGPQTNNTSGFKGVVRHYRKWIAQIHVNGRNKYLGLFETRELASKAYLAAAEREYGEFSRAS